MDQIALEYWYYGFLGRLRDRNEVAAHALRQTVEVNQSNGGNLRISFWEKNSKGAKPKSLKN